MKKIIMYLLIIVIGAAGVYYGLTKFYEKKDEPKVEKSVEEKPKEEVIPSKDAFVSEAIKLQTLAENEENNQTCKCYNVKDLDKNTTLSGSILVHTVDDLFISTMWLSNGYYILDGSETAATGVLTESSDQASLYCGETSASQQSSLCSSDI